MNKDKREACAVALALCLALAAVAGPIPIPSDLFNASIGPTATLPTGNVTLGNIAWQIRGARGEADVIVPAGTESVAVPVNAKAEVLYFLHTYNPGPALRTWDQANWEGKAKGERPLEPPTLFSYVLHYDNGEAVSVNVRWNEGVNAWARAGEWADPPYAPTVWRETVNEDCVFDPPAVGLPSRWPRRGEHRALYAFRFENPMPGKAIASIDIVSANDVEHDVGAPSLLAISTGPREHEGRTYYVAPDGADANPGTFEKPWATPYEAAETLDEGDSVYIRGGRYLLRQSWEDVISVKRSGSTARPITFAAFPGETAVIDGDDHHCAHDTRVPYAIYDRDRGLFNIFEKMNVTVRNLWFEKSRKSGIGVYQTRNVLLDHNTIYATHHCGMNTAANTEFRIIGNTLGKICSTDYAYDLETQEWQPDPAKTPGREAIDNHRNEYTEIAFNEIYHCDKDSIADPGRHFKIHHNHIHDCKSRYPMAGNLYLDAYGPLMEDLDVYDNVIYRVTVGICVGSEGGTRATNIRIHHNLCFDNEFAGIILNSAGHNGPRDGIVIEHNTVHDNGSDDGNPNAEGGIHIGTMRADDITIRHNIVTGNRDYQIATMGHDRVAQSIRVVHNLCDPVLLPPDAIVRRFPHWTPVLGDLAFSGAPRFVDAANWDFRLTVESPAVDVLGEQPDADGTAGDLGAFPVYQRLPALPADGEGLVLRINCGSTQPYRDKAGRLWRADRRLPRDPKPGDWGSSWSQTVERDARPIANTDDPTIYLSERYGMGRYTFLLAPGRYNVRLHFAETWHTEPGRRVFSVLLNGRPALEHFDLSGEAGGVDAAVVREFKVPVYRKGLVIEFSSEKDGPLINGMEIIQTTQ